MGQHLRSLRRQRALGQRRVHAVTAGSAAGAAALAAAFGAVLSAGHGAPAAPAQHTSHPAGDSAAVRSVDIVADISNAHGAAPEVTKGDPNGVAVAEPPAAQAPAGAAEVPAARLPAARPAPAATEQLKAPAQTPKPAPKHTAEAPTGAS